MLEIVPSNQFKRYLNLDEKYHDHGLTGNYNGFRECHVEPDWLLVYLIGNCVARRMYSQECEAFLQLSRSDNFLSHRSRCAGIIFISHRNTFRFVLADLVKRKSPLHKTVFIKS